MAKVTKFRHEIIYPNDLKTLLEELEIRVCTTVLVQSWSRKCPEGALRFYRDTNKMSSFNEQKCAAVCHIWMLG